MSNELKQEQEKKTFSYDIGAYRQNALGVEQEGDDGIFVQRKIVALSDGVGGSGGSGPQVLKHFSDFLEKHQGRFRAAFRDLALRCRGDDKLMATFAGIKFPSDMEGRARMISVGDSSVFRIRYPHIKKMNEAHTLYAALEQEFPDIADVQRKIALVQISNHEINEWLDRIRERIHADYHEKIYKCRSLPFDDVKKQAYKCRKFLAILQFCEGYLKLGLGSPPRVIKKKKDQKEMHVAEGDIWVLCSDGVNSVRKFVSQLLVKNSGEVARLLVKSSTVQDDRSAVVIKVHSASSY